MQLADYLLPLLRAHDCVIIPGFGGLVAAPVPARVQPGGRHVLSPPRRQLAFNQGLTRNDGLLLDVLRQRLSCSAAEAGEHLRQAVASLQQELVAGQRAELPGIGVFRQLAGRGLQFESTATDGLMAAAYGLPELTAHPVRSLDARAQRQQQAELLPRLRAVAQSLPPARRRRVVAGAGLGLLAGLLVGALFMAGLYPDALPAAWRGHLPAFVRAAPQPLPTQQASLAQPSFGPAPESESLPKSIPASPAAPTPIAAAPALPTPDPSEPALNQPLVSPVSQATVVPRATQVPAAAAKAKPTRAAARVRPPALRHTPVPFGPGGLALRRTKMPLPLQATVNKADERNIARPIPVAMRRAFKTPTAVPESGSGSPADLVASAGVVPAASGRELPLPVASVPRAAVAPVVPRAAAVPAAASRPVEAAVTHSVPSPAAPAKAAAPLAADAATVKVRTGRFYVVVAAFVSPAGACQQRSALAAGRFPAKILLPPAGSRLYRVSAADYASLAEANAAAARLRQRPGFDQGLSVYRY